MGHFRNEGIPADTIKSKPMRMVVEQALAAARNNGTVLLLGETGSGKDYLAEFIHRESMRKAGPFISINCAALSHQLIESEVFGHEAGAFTGAQKRKTGLLELAHSGTILLNEIGDLPLPLQPKLLSFLDSGTFYRVGGQKLVRVDTRVLSATNRDLIEDVQNNVFRKDLFYRLEMMVIHVPPLRERLEDLPGLARRIWKDVHGEMRVEQFCEIDPIVVQGLCRYEWLGNVRELRNCLCKLLTSPKQNVAALGAIITEDEDNWSHVIRFPDGDSMNDLIKEAKMALISEALRRSQGKKKMAAEMLGISYVSIHHYLNNLAKMI